MSDLAATEYTVLADLKRNGPSTTYAIHRRLNEGKDRTIISRIFGTGSAGAVHRNVRSLLDLGLVREFADRNARGRRVVKYDVTKKGRGALADTAAAIVKLDPDSFRHAAYCPI